MVEVGFLGPLLLVVDGEPVGVGPVPSVLVLALVCAQGRLVPAVQLGALLAAPGGAPTTAATVRSHVSHLRKALGDGRGPGREAVRAARAHGLESPRLRELQRTILNRTLPEAVLPYLPGVG